MLDIIWFLNFGLFVLVKEAWSFNLPKSNINYLLPSPRKSKNLWVISVLIMVALWFWLPWFPNCIIYPDPTCLSFYWAKFRLGSHCSVMKTGGLMLSSRWSTQKRFHGFCLLIWFCFYSLRKKEEEYEVQWVER